MTPAREKVWLWPACLVSCQPDLARTSLLPTLLDRAVSLDLHTSHGAVLAAGEG